MAGRRLDHAAGPGAAENGARSALERPSASVVPAPSQTFLNRGIRGANRKRMTGNAMPLLLAFNREMGGSRTSPEPSIVSLRSGGCLTD